MRIAFPIVLVLLGFSLAALATDVQSPATLLTRVEARAESGIPNTGSRPVPTRPQLAWQRAEVVALLHFDPRVFSEEYDRQSLQYVTIPDPEAFAQGFNPQKLDTDQWVATAKAMGATVAILVVKHETGFCLWQSDANPYCLKMLKWRDGKADILRDFVGSCKKYGIKPGVFTETRWDCRLSVEDSQVTKHSLVTQAQYNQLVEAEVRELCTRYGELFEWWLDGGARTPAQGGPDLLPIAEQHQPDMIFYHSDQRRDMRWSGTESGTVGDPCWATVPAKLQTIEARQAGDSQENQQVKEKSVLRHGDPNGDVWRPPMADTPLRAANGRHDWIWAPGGETGVLPLEDLQRIYLESVGRNATLVIGLTPDRNGLVPAPDAARCGEFGDWIAATFGGKPMAEISGHGTNLTLDLTLEVAGTVKGPVTHFVLQEDIRYGETVRAFALEAEQNGVWKKMYEGTSIGHKRIVTVPSSYAGRFRLNITRSDAIPKILSFQARATRDFDLIQNTRSPLGAQNRAAPPTQTYQE